MGDQDNDWLDAMMADESYVEDSGFAARVVQQLPAPRAVRQRKRRWVFWSSVTLGLVLSIFVLPGGQVLTRAVSEAVQLGLDGTVQNVSILSLGVLGLLALGTAAAFRTGGAAS
ncbi:MAG: DUF5056 domain-containing protein [Myxococcota bacterium]